MLQQVHVVGEGGIKTIALISVEPWGVVQFGSTQKIPERKEFIEQVKKQLREVKVREKEPPSNSQNLESSTHLTSLLSPAVSSSSNDPIQIMSQFRDGVDDFLVEYNNSTTLFGSSSKQVFKNNASDCCSVLTSYWSHSASWPDQNVPLSDNVPTCLNDTLTPVVDHSSNTLFSKLGLHQFLNTSTTSSFSFGPNGEKKLLHPVFEDKMRRYTFDIKSAKKKAKAGIKPRHKNSQMIQDRLAELRDLIPSGHKGCEVEDQSMVCPLIVEDLDTPVQMLITILCEEGGFFLEIAEIIRGFGLNILKGVTEVREPSNIWANFIVQSEGARRMVFDVLTFDNGQMMGNQLHLLFLLVVNHR
ncbi:serine/threonine-protein kinase WNK (With NoLysine)-related [Striga asiatica]|uniref:Serine/threonine-protein kinase WNK (With NoLysine)-related n=1 Tax=Striga asiatica TaxID=4170 RepID=A0A5A7P795_STRAF|nr:serine/threonine-protein kinase WNK (With NoLysine)-related [Striga asiatica]